MSRTIRGQKGPGYDYWSRRPMSGTGYAKWIKQRTHRVERQRAKDAIRNAAENKYPQS